MPSSRSSVIPSKRSPSCCAGLAVALLPLALADRALLPGEPEPLEVADDLLLPARHVPLRIGVVDPQQHPVAEAAVGDGAEGVTDVQGAGRAGCETDSLHRVASLESGPCGARPARLVRRARTRPAVAADAGSVRDPRLGGDAAADAGRARVPRYLDWLERWPTVEALAAASPADGDPRVARARVQPPRPEPASRRADRSRRTAGPMI